MTDHVESQIYEVGPRPSQLRLGAAFLSAVALFGLLLVIGSSDQHPWEGFAVAGVLLTALAVFGLRFLVKARVRAYPDRIEFDRLYLHPAVIPRSEITKIEIVQGGSPTAITVGIFTTRRARPYRPNPLSDWNGRQGRARLEEIVARLS